MTRYPGSGTVESGWYLDTRRLALVNLPAQGRLPGSSRDSFVRVPWPALLLLAPWVGGAWILVGPLIGLATAAWGVARRAGAAARAGARGLAGTAAPGHDAREAERNATGGARPDLARAGDHPSAS